MVRVLFVCLGNICRSPTAEAVFRDRIREAGLAHAIESHSAGTHAYHVGEGADSRSVRAAGRRGYDMKSHRARRVDKRDFAEFDYVLAMDRENFRNLKTLEAGLPRPVAASRRARVSMLLEFAPAVRFEEVPDPYSLADEGFELVLDMVESACDGLLEHIVTNDLGRASR